MSLDESLPELRVETAQLITKIIHNRFGGTVSQSERPELAQMLGHETHQSGAFNAKLADLGKFGLAEGYGETTLTPLGRDLIQHQESALNQILSNIPLFDAARGRFGDELPTSKEWSTFVDGRTELTVNETTEKRSRKIYNGIVGQLPKQSQSSFSEERFDRYYGDLDDASLRDICLESLQDSTAAPIPSIEYFDKIHAPVADVFGSDATQEAVPFDPETFTDDELRQLISIFAQMCETSTPTVKQERGQSTVELAIAIIEQSDAVSNQRSARTILEAVDPMNIDADYGNYIWDLCFEYLRESYEGPKAHKRDTATNLFALLTERWATESLLDCMEADIYDELKGDPSAEYRSHLEEWHEEVR